MIRNDYMVHEITGQAPMLQQVEINTIASSFGCLGVKVTDLHR